MAEIRQGSVENKRASQVDTAEVPVPATTTTTTTTDDALITEKLDSIHINQQQQQPSDATKISTPETTQHHGNATTSPTTANNTTIPSANNANSPSTSPQNGTLATETPEHHHSAASDATATATTNLVENGDDHQHQDTTTATKNSTDDEEEKTKPAAAPPPPAVHPLVAQLKQQLHQQRQVLDHLEVERSQYRHDNQSLNDRLATMKTKLQQRAEAQQQLETNYRDHLQSMRATPDDLDSISTKLKQLKSKIRDLADELLEQADPVTATHALRTFWLNLHDCIEAMGSPLPLHRVRMLTEKFMMDVLVQNMNLNSFPGLAKVSDHYNDVAFWLEKYDDTTSTTTTMATRLRQEMALVMVKKNTSGSDLHRKLHEAVQANWKFLYGGLIKAYPFVYQYDKHEPDTQKHYGAKVQMLVEHAMTLGFAMKGQEVDVAAAETRERQQWFDPALMIDEDGQTSGIVDFCVCPPFVVYGANVSTLEKGRVLCSPPPPPAAAGKQNGSVAAAVNDVKDSFKTDSPTTTTTTNSVPASTNTTSPIST